MKRLLLPKVRGTDPTKKLFFKIATYQLAMPTPVLSSSLYIVRPSMGSNPPVGYSIFLGQLCLFSNWFSLQHDHALHFF